MKYLIWILIGMMSLGIANAIEMQEACTSKGYNETISMWTFNATYMETYSNGENIDVWGTARKLNWTSEKYVEAVVYKSGTRTYLSQGGFNGTIPKTTLSNDVVFVVFCGNTSDTQTVPEFGVLTGVIALLSGIGMIVYRRR